MTGTWQLKQKQSLPLEMKIIMTLIRIRQWYEHWNGEVYISFSGGKDSTVLLHLVRCLYPEVPAVFIDTGLEYPEIKEFIKTIDNVIYRRPRMSFREVIKKYGYPVISKDTSYKIYKLRHHNLSKKYRNYILHGDERGSMGKLSEKWKFFLEAPFEISSRCCDVMKKQPFHQYERKTGRKPFSGEMAIESQRRMNQWTQHGCNAFYTTHPRSMPLSFWLEEDIWNYLRSNNILYSKIYDMGADRTGCMYCMYGVNLEKYPNRFQRMVITHPRQYQYCINGGKWHKDEKGEFWGPSKEGLGLWRVLEYIGIPYQVYGDGKCIGEMRKFADGKYEQLKLAL
ncbi:MAG: phosphoadenosine phosphosulfate reductase family protein [Clostridia bacterium]|nr:phosphoadenosine phosphosulfate reductase family protein [Clostridia bacterium]